MRRPEWLRIRPLRSAVLEAVRNLSRSLHLHTVCESAFCPNRMDCFSRQTAAFMILGEVCTRKCSFCAIRYGAPEAPDSEEPRHIVDAVKMLGLKYVVITSVTRDDLPDGGASQFGAVIKALKASSPTLAIEVLVPDFQGSNEALATLLNASPEVLNHNIETVPGLYRRVRPQARYGRSLELLARAKSLQRTIVTKSGLMLGLGETRQEVIDTIKDLRQVGCDCLTIGQYLPPSLQHFPLARYVPPAEFEDYRCLAEELGFVVYSAPLVRSSFHAEEYYPLRKQPS